MEIVTKSAEEIDLFDIGMAVAFDASSDIKVRGVLTCVEHNGIAVLVTLGSRTFSTKRDTMVSIRQ